ncbi:MAG: hypothetical protein MI717_03320 [Spirochaetales bacterium]|nr:hypothetical protein [Spirochaetales bacterium]
MKSKALLFGIFFTLGALGFGEEWTFSAQQVSSRRGGGETTTVLEGGARVESESMLILADTIELGGEENESIAGEGGVDLLDKEEGLSIRSQSFEYDRRAKLIRFRQQVSLIDEEEGIVIRCESLDFREEDDVVVMQVLVRLIKEETICRGEFATYSREDGLLEISGRPEVWRNDDVYRAQRITVDLENDEILLQGAVAGSLTTEDEDETTVEEIPPNETVESQSSEDAASAESTAPPQGETR